MKIIFLIIVLILLQLQACVVSSQRPAPNYTVTYQSFYDELSPFGVWINYPGYGYVWVPRLGPGFRPYATNGRWIYTVNGWTWVSNYRWGWGPFHYGRWFLDARYGWVWLPGNQWAPAWVTWGQSGNYYGWAPIGPNMNMNVTANAIPNNYWTFVPNQYINSQTINNYYVNNTTVINNITIINNVDRGPGGRGGGDATPYSKGPQLQDVERVTRQKIRPVPIRDAAKPGMSDGGRDGVTLYRPVINGNNKGTLRPARVEPTDPSVPATRPTPRPGVEPPTNPITRPTVPEPVARPNPVSPSRPIPDPATRPTPRPTIETPITSPNPGSRPTTRPSFPQPSHPTVERPNPALRPATRPAQSFPSTRPTPQTRPSSNRPQPSEKPDQQRPSRRGPR